MHNLNELGLRHAILGFREGDIGAIESAGASGGGGAEGDERVKGGGEGNSGQ